MQITSKQKTPKTKMALLGLTSIGIIGITATIVATTAKNCIASLKSNSGTYSIVFNNKKNVFNVDKPSSQIVYSELGNPFGFSVDERFTLTASNEKETIWNGFDASSCKNYHEAPTFYNTTPIHGIQEVIIRCDCPDWTVDESTGESIGAGAFICFGDSVNPNPDDGWYKLNLRSIDETTKETTIHYTTKDPINTSYFSIGGFGSKLRIYEMEVVYSCAEPSEQPKYTVEEVYSPTLANGYVQDFYINLDSKTGKKENIYYSFPFADHPLTVVYTDGVSTSYDTGVTNYQINGQALVGDNLTEMQNGAYRQNYLNYGVYEGHATDLFTVTVVDKTLLPTSTGTLFEANGKQYMAYIDVDPDTNERNLRVMAVTEEGFIAEGEEVLYFNPGTIPDPSNPERYRYEFSKEGSTSNMILFVDYTDPTSPYIEVAGTWGSSFSIPEDEPATATICGKITQINSYFNEGTPMTFYEGMSFPLDIEFKTADAYSDANPTAFGVRYSVVNEAGEQVDYLTVTSDGLATAQGKVGDKGFIKVEANTNLPSEEPLTLLIPFSITENVNFLELPNIFAKNPNWSGYLASYQVNCSFANVEQKTQYIGGVEVSSEELKIDAMGALYKKVGNTCWFINHQGNYFKITYGTNSFTVDKCTYPDGGEYLNGVTFSMVKQEEESSFPNIFLNYSTWKMQGYDTAVFTFPADEATGVVSTAVFSLDEKQLDTFTVKTYDQKSGICEFVDQLGNVLTFAIDESQCIFTITNVTINGKDKTSTQLGDLLGTTFAAETDWPQILLDNPIWQGTCLVEVESKQNKYECYLGFDRDFKEAYIQIPDYSEEYLTLSLKDQNSEYISFNYESVTGTTSVLGLVLTPDGIVIDGEFTATLPDGVSVLVLNKEMHFSPSDPAPSLEFPYYFQSRTQWKYKFNDAQQTYLSFNYWDNSVYFDFQYEEMDADGNTYPASTGYYYTLTGHTIFEDGVTGELYLTSDGGPDGQNDNMTMFFDEVNNYCMITSTNATVLNEYLLNKKFKLNLYIPDFFTNAEKWKTTDSERGETITINNDDRTIVLNSPDGDTIELSCAGLISDNTYQFTYEKADGSTMVVQATIDESSHSFTISEVYNADSETWSAFKGLEFIGEYELRSEYTRFESWDIIDNSYNKLGLVKFDDTDNSMNISIDAGGTKATYNLKLSYMEGWYYVFTTADGKYFLKFDNYIPNDLLIQFNETNIPELMDVGAAIQPTQPSYMNDGWWETEYTDNVGVKHNVKLQMANVSSTTLYAQIYIDGAEYSELDYRFVEYEGGTMIPCFYDSKYDSYIYLYLNDDGQIYISAYDGPETFEWLRGATFNKIN